MLKMTSRWGNKIISSFCFVILAANLLPGCNTITSKPLPLIQDINQDINALNNSQTFSSESNEGVNTIDPQTDGDGNTIESFIISTQRRIFNEYDLNKSGTIEISELSGAPNSFKSMDKDNNHRLTFNEVMPTPQRVKQMSGWVAGFYKGLFKLVDSDGNNKVTNTELSNSADLEPFKDLAFWKYTIKTITPAKSINKSLNQQQFNVMMNNLFLSLHKKYTNYRNTPYTTTDGKLPVMLVQGYAEPSWYFMYGIYKDLKNNGWESIYPVNLFPNVTDIKEQAAIIAGKIEQAKKEQGVNRVDYVCHSMGGLIGRYYIQNIDSGNSIARYTSIATPHYGTNIAWLGIGEGAKQMRPGSEFLTNLNSGNPIYPNIRYTSMWTKTDEIVVPAESALLRGSLIMPDISYTGHLLVLWAPDTYKQVRESLIN